MDLEEDKPNFKGNSKPNLLNINMVLKPVIQSSLVQMFFHNDGAWKPSHSKESHLASVVEMRKIKTGAVKPNVM